MIEIDKKCITDYTNGIQQLLDSVKSVTTKNNATDTYTKELKRITDLKPFEQKTERLIMDLFEQSKSKLDPLLVEFSPEWKKACFYNLMDILKDKGVQFTTPGNTCESHASYMNINKDIDDVASQYMVPGSFLLYYFSFLCRINAKPVF